MPLQFVCVTPAQCAFWYSIACKICITANDENLRIESPCSLKALDLMVSEGGRRAKTLKINGCNYFGKRTIRSAPFAIFSRQDILRLALELDVPVPEIYGTIEQKEDGTLYTTKAQRTGCSMCGFGIHSEKRLHRFDLLRERSEKEWRFWMYDIGWGHVLDYIGVEWEGAALR